MMLECNLKLFGGVLLFANANKSTRKYKRNIEQTVGHVTENIRLLSLTLLLA